MTNIRNCSTAILLAFALVAGVGCAAPEQRQTVGEYIDDSVITTRVKAAIFDDSQLRSHEISVETFDGAVQLSGFVSSQADIDRAVEVTRRVSGVLSVRNSMVVK